jgi:hypothetical protein
MLRSYLVAAAFLPLAGTAFAAELVAPTALTTTFFDSKPITTTDAKGRASQLTFTPNGTLTRTAADGKSSEGTWRLSEDGFCMQLAPAKRESCYVVLKRDDGKFSALRQSGQPFTWEK